MKRMNVREFRAKISELNTEPIEVVRYSETVGFWVPIAMTTEPKRKPRLSGLKPILTTAKPMTIKKTMSVDEMKDIVERVRKMNEEMKKLTIK